ncbi:LytR/AlgR family response regulator transcription factor [Luteirhabdus pelagi]|uniref:LytR/AlgR family response regulator transcription factor n=1 Tax=Luteirhabdus pelagi TaxID=2792783 RepID=UPI00193A77BD|nr:LytTR family DNA-binding domain-containing protein [Luteirhabdus pelagi]
MIVLSGLHLLVFSVSVVAISTFPLYEHPYSFSKVFGYGLANQLWILFLAYMGLYFYIIKKVKRNLRNRNRKSRIMVSVASKRIFIDCNAIQYIQTERPYLAIHTAEKTYLHADTLTNMKERLKLEGFIQIHRSCLVNEVYIKAMVSRGNGDYDLELHSGKVLRLSRTYTQNFRNVFSFAST